MMLDIDALRQDLIEENLGAFFVGGYGGAIIENSDIENASPSEIIEIAESRGIDTRRFEI